MKLFIALLLAVLILTGCSNRIYSNDALPLPERPALPPVTDKALACLPHDTYRALALRDAAMRQHVDKLEAIIQSTH